MGNHAKDPHKTQQFQSQNCQICGKGFATEASLNLHMEKKHRDILSPADESSNVSMLVVRQPKPKAYVCVLCSKSYTTESALAIHAVKVQVFLKRSEGGRRSTEQSVFNLFFRIMAVL